MVVLYGTDVHKVGLHVTVGGQEAGVPLLRAVHAPLRVEHNLNIKHLSVKNPRTFSLQMRKNIDGEKSARFLSQKRAKQFYLIVFVLLSYQAVRNLEIYREQD
jgi:hypothetical protein